MTTEAAAKLYEAQHTYQMGGKPTVVFNPLNKSPDELPRIFALTFGGSYGWMPSYALAEDGAGLGSHICSSEAYIPCDLGVLEGTRDDRHEGFRKHYPDGYAMEFVPMSKQKEHTKLQAALELNSKQRIEDEAMEGK